jgi:quercetin dioxygenase-like cupin family protein
MRERIKGKTLIARDEGDDASGVIIKLYGEETNGVISIIEQPFEPGLLLPPHVHQNDVWLYVLEGEMHARVGDEVVKATPGSWVRKPRRIPHTMWNAGPEPARIIELYTPGGFELFFRDFGERLRQGPIGLDELNRLGEPHGIRFFDDWVPDLKAAYNVRPPHRRVAPSRRLRVRTDDRSQNVPMPRHEALNQSDSSPLPRRSVALA